MDLSNYNNLLELFNAQYKKVDKNDDFLQSLKGVNLKYNWNQTYISIQKLSSFIRKHISPKQRCLLIS